MRKEKEKKIQKEVPSIIDFIFEMYISYGFWHSRLNNPDAAPITGDSDFDDDNNDDTKKRLKEPLN